MNYTKKNLSIYEKHYIFDGLMDKLRELRSWVFE